MAAQDSISDPTDWLNTPVASLEPLEAGLRCEICKDFFTAPVLTACCHTFCSGCIRRSLSSVNASRKCPLCWSPFDEGQLRKNKVVEELVKTFQAARGDILALGRAARDGALNTAHASKKRRLNEVENGSQTSGGPSPRKTRSQTHHRSRVVSDSVEPEEDDMQPQDSDDRPGDGLFPCPICQQMLPELQMNPHLDGHLEKKPVAAAGTSSGLPSRTQTTTPTMNPLPTLSYNLLNDVQLRKKLRELGIPADGTKQMMSRRHTEWRNLVNANCDSSRPKSKSELLKELNQWERTQNSVNHTYGVKASKNAVMEKDFDRSDWSSSHSGDFQSLIAAARAKAKAKAQTDAQPTGEEESSRLAENGASIARTRSPADIPPSSQVNIVNLISPEKIQPVNGFDVP